MKKGYLMTLMAIVFILMLYYYYLENNKMRVNINSRNLALLSIERVGYYVDDVVDDLRNLISIDNKGNLTIVENLSINKSLFFSEYSNFMKNYSNATGVNFSLLYSNPIVVNYFGAHYYSFFNGTILFVNDSFPGSTLPFTFYEITINANESYISYDEWDWKTTGTYVRINYSDPNNSFLKEGYINPSTVNEFLIQYPSGNVTILTGRIDTYRNSFALNQNGQVKYLKLIAYPNPSQSDLFFNIKMDFKILDANYSSFIPIK